MKLENISVEVRPRKHWEAADLGCILARKHFFPMIKAWCSVVAPIALTLSYLLYEYPTLALFMIWWLKPLYERIPLLYLGQALFGSKPSTFALLRMWIRTLFFRLFSDLVVYRLSPRRSLWLPVEHLESLTGKAGRERMDVLARAGHSHSFGLMQLCLVFELVIALALIGLVVMFLPEHVQLDMNDLLLELQYLPVVWHHVFNAIYFFSMTLVEMFFISSSFALYINCRTILEGWDLELIFRKMVHRLQAMTQVAVMICCMWMLTCASLSASEPEAVPLHPASVIEQVLQHDDFEIHTRKEYVLKNQGNEQQWFNWSGIPWLANLGGVVESLVWLVLAIGIVWAFYYLLKNRSRYALTAPTTNKPDKARTVMGMALAPEALPDDIHAEAKRQWLAGNAHYALTLLYQGSLAWMVNQAKLNIEKNFTEKDCLRCAEDLPEQSRYNYFAKLTHMRLRLVYGKLVPDNIDMEYLFNHWPFHLQTHATVQSTAT